MKPLAPNSLIQNRYLIVHLIGKGGMGEVYLAVDQRLGSAVALKRTFFADDEMLGSAFEREARTLARLRHPVLPKVSDHFIENGEQYLVMEHIAGDDLAKRLEVAQKPFPLSWVLFWADQLLDALAYLHSHEPPIIHRDIKPQNLKLTDENHIVLLDFGLSKNTTGQSKVTSGSSGSVVGYTPHYAPMEQVRGTGTNPRSDIYSLSATLYQLMTNVVPDDALTRADALLNGSADPIHPLNELNPEISPDVSSVILRGMEVSQEKRFSNAKEMQRALRKAYSEMQEAMTAQTVAFSTPEVFSSKIEQPGGDHSSDHTSGRRSGDSEEATRIRDGQRVSMPASFSETGSPDATFEYAVPVDSGPRQADVKTEVYQAGETPFYPESDQASSVNSEPVPDFYSTSVIDDVPEFTSQPADDGFAPDSTVPVISFESESSRSAATSPEFSTASGVAEDPYATRTPPRALPENQVGAAGVAVPAKKSSSKAVWFVGGLAVLFFFAAVAAGAGWFIYTNYYAVAVQPTPEPSPEPTPEPTVEALIESNTDMGSSDVSNTNTNTAPDVLIVEPTPMPEVETGEANAVTRPSPQIGTRKTPVRTGNTPPGAKPTPRKTPDRTVILQ